MSVSSAARNRAARLRRRLRRGSELSPDEARWLARYEEHVPPRADVADAPAPVVEAEPEDAVDAPEELVDDEDAPAVELAPAVRIERAAADREDHGTSLLIRAVEMHERVSERALAMCERMGALAAQQSEQLVDALSALAEARAEVLASREVEAEAEAPRTDVDGAMTRALIEQFAPKIAPKAGS